MPAWPYSRSWGAYPSGILGVVLVIVIVLVLMRVITGLIKPEAGEVELFGRNVKTLTPGERVDIESRWGVLFQEGALFSSLTVLQNIQVPMREHLELPQAMMDDLAFMKLAMVGLPPNAAYKYPSELSGGMIKRAAIARAIALDPPLVFLDEPSAGLDPITSAGLDALIVSLARDLGITFVVVTHELASILAIADRIIMLDKGARGMIAEGDPRKLKEESTHPVVRAFFNRTEAETG